MKTITLDFTKCKYITEIHKILKESFAFPDYYGENLSALWDCLDYYCDYPLHVNVVGISKIPRDLKDYIGKILNIFNDVSLRSPNIVFEIVS